MYRVIKQLDLLSTLPSRVLEMISGKESIFHLGEDGDEAGKSVVSIRRLTEHAKGDEGLRILIHQREQGGIRSRSTAACCSSTSIPSKGLPELGFLESCLFCKKEISQSKDVYMYRGDEGFCSEECRSRQILRDERREFEMATRDRWGSPNSHLPRHHLPVAVVVLR